MMSPIFEGQLIRLMFFMKNSSNFTITRCRRPDQVCSSAEFWSFSPQGAWKSPEISQRVNVISSNLIKGWRLMKDEFPENSLLDVIDNTTSAFAWGRSATDQEDTNNIKRSTDFRKEAHPSLKDFFFYFLACCVHFYTKIQAKIWNDSRWLIIDMWWGPFYNN